MKIASLSRRDAIEKKLNEFFLKPASPLPLACLRISLAVILLVQVYFVRESFFALFSRSGLIQGPLADLMRSQDLPHVGWLANWLAPYGIPEATCLQVTAFAYAAAVIFFGLGLFTRAASIATWFLHWFLMITAFSSTYGVDSYAHIFLFYLMWMPAGDALSLDAARAGAPLTGQPGWQARLALRVLQLHLCVSYLASAIEKSFGVQWRTGEILWRAFNLPIFIQYDLTWMAHWPVLLFIGSWATLILEGAYPIFIWPRATRKIWLAGIVALHLGIAVFLGLHLFGYLMCALSLCAFGVPAEPGAAFSFSLAKSAKRSFGHRPLRSSANAHSP